MKLTIKSTILETISDPFMDLKQETAALVVLIGQPRFLASVWAMDLANPGGDRAQGL